MINPFVTPVSFRQPGEYERLKNNFTETELYGFGWHCYYCDKIIIDDFIDNKGLVTTAPIHGDKVDVCCGDEICVNLFILKNA